MNFLTAETIHRLLVEYGQFEWHDEEQVNLRIYEHAETGLFYSLPLEGENHINPCKLKETLLQYKLIDEKVFKDVTVPDEQENE